MKIYLFLLLALGLACQVWGRGVIRIRFLKYENFDGKDAKGTCCDRGFTCYKNGCDPMFFVCLDEISRLMSNDTNKAKYCRYGHEESGVSQDRDNVTFGTKIGTTPNPLNFSFSGAIPREMALRVLVEDYDRGSSNDLVEHFHYRLAPQAANVHSGRPFPVVIQGRTRLTTEVTVQCAANYYGADCNTQCRPPAAGQHYTCNPTTGAIVCDRGWAGSRCTVRAEECTRDWCFNQGLCTVNSSGKKTCECHENLSGPRCEFHACDQRCAGGECRRWGIRNDEFECICGQGYEVRRNDNGEYCEYVGSSW